MFTPKPKRSFLETLILGAIIIGVVTLGAVVLYGATGWLWRSFMRVCIDRPPLPAALDN
jgi:hypothetical protein